MFLASKRDTKEVCALKVMSKKLLFKLDEIRHILTERDILTAAKSEWLVKLLYAFQDESSIYLAMVSDLSFYIFVLGLFYALLPLRPSSFSGL